MWGFPKTGVLPNHPKLDHQNHQTIFRIETYGFGNPLPQVFFRDMQGVPLQEQFPEQSSTSEKLLRLERIQRHKGLGFLGDTPMGLNRFGNRVCLLPFFYVQYVYIYIYTEYIYEYHIICVYICVCIYICMYTHMYVYTYVCILCTLTYINVYKVLCEYHVMSYQYAILYYIKSYHVISYQIISYRIILYYIALQYIV